MKNRFRKVEAPIINFGLKQEIVEKPTLAQRFEAAKLLGQTLPLETVLELCWEIFADLVRTKQLPLNKKGIQAFGNIANQMFDLSLDEQNQFRQYFSDRKNQL